MEPRASCVLQPHACATRGALVSGYVWSWLHCTLFSRNPYNYPSPLSLNYLEESHHMSIASWLIKQESTQLMNNLEQDCLEQKSRLIPFRLIQSFLHYIVQWERLLISFFVKTWQRYPGQAWHYLCNCPRENRSISSQARKWRRHKPCQLVSTSLPYYGSRRHPTRS